MRKSDQQEGFEFHTIMSQGIRPSWFETHFSSTNSGRLITYHRVQFQQILLDRLPITCQVHYSKRLTSYVQASSGEITINFLDGSTATCDVLLGADGLKSATRASLFKDLAQKARESSRSDEADSLISCIEPTFSGLVAYRSLIPRERLQDHPLSRNLEIPLIPTLVRAPFVSSQLSF